MNDRERKRAEEIFQQAADLPEEERSAFLDEKCKNDAALRKEVESLLACLRDQGVASLNDVDRVDETDLSLKGRRIGPYKLIQLIGEGGFGSVYEAEQEEPIRRIVALKIIKLGMDTKKVIARFEIERQALAMMDHPNIARVLDAGATETGRPYFVMELVKGIPITEFCDRRNLDIVKRLELFARVCQAIQHAHQKGIIHRDLKPSNVLVTLKDGVPIPKVIDFGIAKATDRRLSEETFFTDYHYFMGTPEYMSPEQVGSGAGDVDTRTDIYSLGVLLYVLLTSKTPFDWKTLGRAAFGEVQRIIREEDPPTPSVCVNKLGTELEGIAKTRQLAPNVFSRLMRGDLDWIVMKSLEKDRSRRYETAADFASDIQHYMNHEPVQAGPPGALYKMGKFIRRHRIGVTAAAAIAAALIGGFALAAKGYFEARTARAEAVASAERAQAEALKSQAVTDFLQEMLASADPENSLGREVSVREVLDDASRMVEEESTVGPPEVQVAVRKSLADTYESLGLFDAAEKHAKAAVQMGEKIYGADAPETLAAQKRLAAIVRRQGFYDRAEALLQPVLEAEERILGPDHPDTLSTMTDLATTLSRQGRYEESEALQKKILETQERVLGDEHEETVRSMFQLGTTMWHQERYQESERLLRKVLEKDRNIHGENHPDTLKVMNNLGLVLGGLRRYDEAEEIFRSAIEIQKKTFGHHHHDTHRTMDNLARMLRSQGRNRSAHAVTKDKIASIKLGLHEPGIGAGTLNSFAWFLLTCEYEDLQDPQTALILAKRAVEESEGRRPDLLDTLALAFQRTDDPGKAIGMQRKALVLSWTEPTVNRATLEMALIGYLLDMHDPGGEVKKYLDSIQKQSGKKLDPDTFPGELLMLAGEECAKKGKHAMAEVFFRECLDIRMKILPKDNPRIIEILPHLTGALTVQGKSEEVGRVLKMVEGSASSDGLVEKPPQE
ncbi:MAG: tetratricopeptide repeat protein [Planctomycetota bacterium]